MVGHIERFNPASVGPFPPRIGDVGIITHKIRKVTITATGGVTHVDYLEQSLEIWE